MIWFSFVVALLAGPGSPAPEAAPFKEPDPQAQCTYRTYNWSTVKKKAVNHRTVKKTRGELTAEERDPSDPRCTVCREDQVTLNLEGMPKITVCTHYADKVKAALEETVAAGFKIRTLIGYRVGRTRGRIKDGLRQQFSNHSYGTAIDINARENGLYGKCRLKETPHTAADIKRCKLRVGGAWDPKRRPKSSVVEGGPAHQAFTRFWKWGGARTDKVKDFMHFSPTGE